MGSKARASGRLHGKSRPIHFVDGSCASIGPTSPNTQTSKPSTSASSPPSTSCAVVSPAKTLAAPVKARASTGSARVFGTNSDASSRGSNPRRSLSKTLPVEKPGGCPRCGLNCASSDTLRGPWRFGLATSAPRTDGRVSLSSHWPTATAEDATRGARAPRAGPMLSDAVKLWPTATAEDARASGSRALTKDKAAHPGLTLTDVTSRQRGHRHLTTCKHGAPCQLRLNPRFVESLMGFPTGWTEID